MSTAKFINVHPGELLREEFLKPMGITAYDSRNRRRCRRSG